MTIFIAILASSIWGAINTIVAGLMVRSRTKSESGRLKAEALKFQTDAEIKIYDSLQKQLTAAIDRAAEAEDRANEAIAQSHLQGTRIMKLIKMFEEHIPWDRWIKAKIIELGVPEAEIPQIPELNPYSVLDTTVLLGNHHHRRDHQQDLDDEEKGQR